MAFLRYRNRKNVRWRPTEHKIVASARERPNLGILSVVADADDGSLGKLDDPSQFLRAAAITGAHSVHLVHDDQLLPPRDRSTVVTSPQPH